MNKEEFINELRSRLKSLPETDVETSLDYYSEMIDDCIEGGMSEEESVKSMGTIEEIAGQILSEVQEKRSVHIPKESPKKEPNKLRIWEILFLILGAPVWAPILISVLAAIFSVYVAIWSVIVVFYSGAISLGAGALCGIIGSIALAFTANSAQAMLFFGSGLLCVGLTILWFMVCNLSAKWVVHITGYLIRFTTSLFKRKGRAIK